MKRTLYIAMIAAVLALTGCGEGKKKTGVKGTTGTRDRIESGQGGADLQRFDASTNSDIGSIVADSSASDIFNQALKGLVSATEDPSKLGFVSPTKGQSTWARFKIKIKLNSNGSVKSDESYILIMIKDDKVVESTTGEGVPPFSIFIDGKSAGSQVVGQLNGNSLNVTFEDQFGAIILSNATVTGDNGVYLGQIDFQNKKYFDDSRSGVGGTLGGFEIAVPGSISY